MPFTLSHPAAVMFLRRTRLPLSALIIGSMTPDLNYFIMEQHEIGHTIAGLFIFCLPAGIVMYLLFHYFLKYPLLELLPDEHSAFLNTYVKRPHLNSFKKFFQFLIAILLGAATHLMWDSFTHHNGWVVTHVSWMNIVVVDTEFKSLQLYRIFQHLSTIAGAAIILFFYIKAYNTQKERKPFPHLFKPGMRIIIVTLLVLGSLGLSGFLALPSVKSVSSVPMLRNVVYWFVIETMELTAGVISSYALLWFIVRFFKGRINKRKSATISQAAIDRR